MAAEETTDKAPGIEEAGPGIEEVMARDAEFRAEAAASACDAVAEASALQEIFEGLCSQYTPPQRPKGLARYARVNLPARAVDAYAHKHTKARTAPRTRRISLAAAPALSLQQHEAGMCENRWGEADGMAAPFVFCGHAQEQVVVWCRALACARSTRSDGQNAENLGPSGRADRSALAVHFKPTRASLFRFDHCGARTLIRYRHHYHPPVDA